MEDVVYVDGNRQPWCRGRRCRSPSARGLRARSHEPIGLVFVHDQLAGGHRDVQVLFGKADESVDVDALGVVCQEQRRGRVVAGQMESLEALR